MFTKIQPYSKKLHNGLVMKSISSKEDVESLVSFNRLIHGEESDARLIRTLIMEHPYSKPDYFIFIEEESDKKIVSSLCLIPWIWQFKGIKIRTGEMGFVGTLREYRNRGLIRKLNERFVELLKRDNFLMSHIQGIAYFYKQFGYEYAIPLEGGFKFDLSNIEDSKPDDQKKIRISKATIEDVPILMQLYEDSARKYDITSTREKEIWNFLFGPALSWDPTMEIWRILDQNDNITGYFRITQIGFGKGLILNEVSDLTHKMAQAVFKKLKELCKKNNQPFVRLNLHKNTTLIKTGLSLGAIDLGHYAWQIKIIDLKRFFEKISTVFEQRINESPFEDLTEKIFISLYRKTLALNFINGKIKEVEVLDESIENNLIRIPPNLVVPLILGYYSREELSQHHHDLLYEKRHELLIDILFPKMNSFIYSNY